ncbi:MAG: DegV family protein, partial [Syntrophomonadaceae bacterium]
NVFTVDSLNLCAGSGYLVHTAALMAQQGAGVREILSTVRDMIPRIESSFVVDELDYLRRGGRCSALTEQGARLLQIRPCIEVVKNRMVIGKKYRGSFSRCLQHYIEDRLKDRRDIDYRRVYVANARCQPDILAAVKTTVAGCAPFEETVECEAGCTISNHCGPNTVGIFFMRKQADQIGRDK